jgi:hypothetical protein
MTLLMLNVPIVESMENLALMSIVWQGHMHGEHVKRNVRIPTNK